MTKQYLAGFSDTVSDATVAGLISSITSTTGTVDYSNVTFATSDVPDTVLTSPVWNVKVFKSSANSGTLIAQLASYGTTPVSGGGTLYICSVYNSTKTSWARVASPTGSYAEIVNPPHEVGRSRDDVVALASCAVTFFPSILFENTEAPGEYGALPHSVEVWKRGDTITMVAHPTYSNETYTCLKENDEWTNWILLFTNEGGSVGQLVTTVASGTPALRANGNEKRDDSIIISSGEDVATSTYLKLNYTNESGTDFTLSAYNSAGNKALVGKSDGTLKWGGTSILRDKDNSHMLLCGATGLSNGACCYLYGKSSSECTGEFWIGARTTADNAKWLAGKPDGTLIWNNKYVQACSKPTVTASALVTGVGVDFCYEWLTDHALLMSFIFSTGAITTTSARTSLISISITGGKSIRQAAFPITGYELAESSTLLRCEILSNKLTIDAKSGITIPGGYYQATGVVYVW